MTSLLHVRIQLSSSMLHCNVRVVFSLVCGQHLVALLFSLRYSLLYCNGRGHMYALGASRVNQLSVSVMPSSSHRLPFYIIQFLNIVLLVSVPPV